MSDTLYKWLTEDHRGVYGHGDYSEYLPKGKRPGKWLPKIQNVEPCARGYHVVTLVDLVEHLQAERAVLYTVEVRGASVDAGDKLACEQIRLLGRVGAVDARVLRLFACDCAAHVLPLFEQEHPDDNRPRAAIEAARAWIADPTPARAAARDAAGAAAGDAAGDGAWAAARAAAGDAAGAASWAAAWAAARDDASRGAWDAAWAAARDDASRGAWDAERNWQSERLLALAAERGVL